ncbi:4649_t:CDS:2, partial [Entrophospora sp. SA101]
LWKTEPQYPPQQYAPQQYAPQPQYPQQYPQQPQYIQPQYPQPMSMPPQINVSMGQQPVVQHAPPIIVVNHRKRKDDLHTFVIIQRVVIIQYIVNDKQRKPRKLLDLEEIRK